MTRSTHEDANKRKKWPLAAYGGWQLANDGAETNGGGIVGGVTVSPQGASLAKAFDTSVWTNLEDTAGNPNYAAAYQLFQDSPGVGDAVAFGGAVPFCEITVAVGGTGTTAVYDEAAVLAWEYSDGASSWAALTLAVDNTESATGTGDLSFGRDGAISFIPPADWAKVAVSGTTAYWIRAVVQTDKGDNMTTVPIVDTGEQHSIVDPLRGFTCPHGGTVTGIRTADAALGTLHSGTAVHFILMNFTTGDHSGDLAMTLATRQNDYTGLTLAVNQGDELGVLVTAWASGDDDPTNVMLELQVSG